MIKSKHFTNMSKWVVDNMDNEPNVLLRNVYDRLVDALTPSGIAQAVVIVADYQYKSAFVVDQEVNIVACLTEIMHRCEFA